MSQLYSDSIFWIETAKVNPNPYQPRKEFDPAALEDLADSIRQYGVLQPLVVTRVEHPKDDGGMSVEYELIAGERRLRASKLAGLQQVPVIIRRGENSKMKLELAIIENLQREDLNPIDRARAFARLADEFGLTHAQIGKKMGKSRAYVSNSLRLLQLPQDIMEALQAGRISEGHTRPLMMLSGRPMEQTTLFKEIMYKKMSVRDSEKIARSIASEKARKPVKEQNPRIMNFQNQLSERLGTRVAIEEKEVGGKIVIDFFSAEDIESILKKITEERAQETMLDQYIARKEESAKEHTDIENSNGLSFSASEESAPLAHAEDDTKEPAKIDISGSFDYQKGSIASDNTDQSTHLDTQTSQDEVGGNNDEPMTTSEPDTISVFEDQEESLPEDTQDDLYGIHNFDIDTDH